VRRVLVCGGRSYDDAHHVYAVLDALHKKKPIHIIIHGAARGADTIADHWAASRKVSVMRFPAAWDRLGKAAGAVRNAEMLQIGRPDLVVAFPGGKGTAHMKALAKANRVEVLVAR
jgi:hypothetical protein